MQKLSDEAFAFVFSTGMGEPILRAYEAVSLETQRDMNSLWTRIWKTKAGLYDE